MTSSRRLARAFVVRTFPVLALLGPVLLGPVRLGAAQHDPGRHAHPSAPTAVGSLSDVFAAVFTDLLTERFSLSPGAHAQHYFPASQLVAGTLAPTLNTLIATNISSFPMSSTVAGITFDFSSGQPVQIVESPGPIFAETAATLGENKMMVGTNATHLTLNKLRTMNLEDMAFTFLHQDIGAPGRGDEASERDLVQVRPNLRLASNIVAVFGSYGITPNLDVGVGIPFITIRMEGTAVARIDSYTLTATGLALHFFGGEVDQPLLEDELAFSQSASGVGDVAVRLKYRFGPAGGVDVATLLDVRLPTGSEENFLGTGALNARVALIGSKKMGGFTPHLNAGYNYRGADLDSDELEFAAGFDQQMAQGLSLAFDLLGELDLNSFEAVHLLPGSETLVFAGAGGAAITQDVPLSNIPDRDRDHTLMASLGVRWAPTQHVQLLGNVLVPLLQTGLRSTIVPTVGVGFVL